MKMIASSRLRRAQERVLGARPFAHQALEVLVSLASRANAEAHPLLAERTVGPESKTLLVVVTADKGLCGAFNTNILKQAQAFVLERKGAIREIHCVGRKGRDCQ